MNEEEIKIGDVVRLINCSLHNSTHKDYYPAITFSESEEGKEIEILDIQITPEGSFAYVVMSSKGLTYLRRDAFELVEKKHEQKEENMNYLIDLFKKLNIN